jgi:hypothetical protein
MNAAGKPVTSGISALRKMCLTARAAATALGARDQHVLLAHLLDEGVLGQHRHDREAADHEADQRQRRCQK